jgi:hypothetical protein
VIVAATIGKAPTGPAQAQVASPAAQDNLAFRKLFFRQE